MHQAPAAESKASGVIGKAAKHESPFTEPAVYKTIVSKTVRPSEWALRKT